MTETTVTPCERDSLGRIIRGKPVGNPNGRPKGSLNRKTLIKLATLREEMRPHVQLAIETLVNLARDENTPPAVRRGAATDILDRFYGKPKENIKIEGDGANLMPNINIVFTDRPEETIKVIEGSIDG